MEGTYTARADHGESPEALAGASVEAAGKSAPAASSETGDVGVQRAGRVPRRVLHFSDGVLEEYSTDEDEQNEDQVDDGRVAVTKPPQALVKLRQQDPKSLHWLPWTWYWMRVAGYNTFHKMDLVGERLAFMFGITSPKYQYELEEYFEQKRQEEDEKRRHELESAGWTSTDPAANQRSPAAADNQSASPVNLDQPITTPLALPHAV